MLTVLILVVFAVVVLVLIRRVAPGNLTPRPPRNRA